MQRTTYRTRTRVPLPLEAARTDKRGRCAWRVSDQRPLRNQTVELYLAGIGTPRLTGHCYDDTPIRSRIGSCYVTGLDESGR